MDTVNSKILNTPKKERLSWPDIARGGGVCLVILGHLLYSSNMPWLNKAIYSFHVPMFFIVSGFLYKHGNASWCTFIWNKSKRLLIPAILSVVFFSTFIFFHDRSIGKAFVLLFKNTLYIYGNVGQNAPAWFFFCLFEVFVLARVLSLDKQSVQIKFLIIFLAFLGGWTVSPLARNWFGCKNMLPALGFFGIGSVLKQSNLVQKLNSWLWLFCSFCIWFFFGCYLNGKVSMYSCYWGKNYYFIFSGIAGSMCWIGFVQYFSNIPMLIKTLSTNSVFIICTHYLFVIPYAKFVLGFQIHKTKWVNPLCILYFYVVICMYWLVCWILNLMVEMDKLHGVCERFKQRCLRKI